MAEDAANKQVATHWKATHDPRYLEARAGSPQLQAHIDIALGNIQYLYDHAEEFGGADSQDFREEMSAELDELGRHTQMQAENYAASRQIQNALRGVAEEGAGYAQASNVLERDAQAWGSGPVADIAPGQADFQKIHGAWSEARRYERELAEVWQVAEREGYPRIDILADPRVQLATTRSELAQKKLGQAATEAGVPHLAKELKRVAHHQEHLQTGKQRLAQALGAGDINAADYSTTLIQTDQKRLGKAEAKVKDARDELRRGVTAGIPGAETGNPKIKPGSPAQVAGGLATLAATAVPAIASGIYDQTQDPYERLRFMSLRGLRRPLKLSDMNTSTLGLLLQDPQMSDRLYREGLLDEDLQDRLVAKRQEHGY